VGFFVFGLVSKRLRMSPITPPMVFTLLGLVACPRMLGLADFDITGGIVHLFAELTLALVLFTDASRMNLKQLGKEHNLPLRMLLIGLPLTVLLGTAGAWAIFPGLGFWGAALLAVILAPTDAALGQAVVSDPAVPARIRQALNVESGLNDGICLPLFLFVLACFGAGGYGHAEGGWFWPLFALKQLVFGPLAGIAVGIFGGKLAGHFSEKGWMDEDFQRLSGLVLAFGAFGLAELFGGNGFIAAFIAGLSLGMCEGTVKERMHAFGETEGELFALLIFLIFGEAVIIKALAELTWNTILYALLSLTLFRMLPVALSVGASGIRPSTTAFLGWFGPRGIASILFALVLFEETALAEPGSPARIIWDTTAVTVFLSIMLHGLSAVPLSRRYGKYIAKVKEQDAAMDDMEAMPVPELRVRIKHDTL
jgi:NhaP-type Na+/H+ or K+/H+ antiporter